jgi:hypothetical protein
MFAARLKNCADISDNFWICALIVATLAADIGSLLELE